jgi:hypothetical protein
MRRPTAFSLVLLAVVLSGCGSGRVSDDDYRLQISSIDQDLTSGAQAVQTAAGAHNTLARLQATLGRFEETQRRIAEGLAAVKPPKRAEAAHALLIRGARDFEAEIHTTRKKLRSVSTHREALRLLQRELQNPQGVRELGRAFRELHRLGYFNQAS